MIRIRISKLTLAIIWIVALHVPGPAQTLARPPETSPREQTVYVPVYSQIYFGDKMRLLNLTVTLSIRNTDPVSPITIVSINYHDSNGKLIKKYLDAPVVLGPLGAANHLVPERDISGGPTPSFLVTWKSEKHSNEPRIEGVMIGVISGQGISFLTEGRPISVH